MLSENDKKYVIGRYHILLEKYGYNPKAIGWPKGDPSFRYHILTSIACLCAPVTVTRAGLRLRHSTPLLSPAHRRRCRHHSSSNSKTVAGLLFRWAPRGTRNWCCCASELAGLSSTRSCRFAL